MLKSHSEAEVVITCKRRIDSLFIVKDIYTKSFCISIKCQCYSANSEYGQFHMTDNNIPLTGIKINW